MGWTLLAAVGHGNIRDGWRRQKTGDKVKFCAFFGDETLHVEQFSIENINGFENER